MSEELKRLAVLAAAGTAQHWGGRIPYQYYRAILEEMGPAWPELASKINTSLVQTENVPANGSGQYLDIPKRGEEIFGYRRRVVLSLCTVKYVLPLWEYHHPHDHTPHALLFLAEQVYSGRTRYQAAAEVYRITEHYGTYNRIPLQELLRVSGISEDMLVKYDYRAEFQCSLDTKTAERVLVDAPQRYASTVFRAALNTLYCVLFDLVSIPNTSDTASEFDESDFDSSKDDDWDVDLDVVSDSSPTLAKKTNTYNSDEDEASDFDYSAFVDDLSATHFMTGEGWTDPILTAADAYSKRADAEGTAEEFVEPERQREFWQWWLTEAVPYAYFSV